MEQMIVVKKIFRNALLVQIIATIVGVIGLVVDGAITGRCLGTDAMTAYGLVSPVVLFFVAIASVCELGTSILIGKLVGARKTEEASRALSTCFLFVAGLAVAVTAAVYLLARPIAGLLGAEGVLADMAVDYLRGFSFSAPAMFLMLIFMPIMQIDGERPRLLLAVVMMTVVNVIGDFLVGLVFHGGLLEMALATTASYTVAVLILFPYFFSGKSSLKISLKGISPHYFGEMLTGGLPNALQQACKSLLTWFLNFQLLRIADSRSVAAFTAIMASATLCMALGTGIASSVSMLTGVFAGERDDVAIRGLLKIALRTALIYDALLLVVLMAGADFLMPLFTAETDILALAAAGFRLYSLSMIGFAVNVTFRLYYQSMHYTTLSYVVVACNSFLFPAAAALVMSSLFGVTGIWLSFLVGEAATFLLIAMWSRLKGDKEAKWTQRFLMIPKNFAEDVLERFDASAQSVEDVVRVSENVQAFCRKNGSDPRTAFLLSLAVEELGEYLLENNSAGKEKETVEIRLLCKKDCWTLRLRDNGRRFNPLLAEKRGEDDFAYIGIKLLKEELVGMTYVDTLNINHLLMELPRKV